MRGRSDICKGGVIYRDAQCAEAGLLHLHAVLGVALHLMHRLGLALPTHVLAYICSRDYPHGVAAVSRGSPVHDPDLADGDFDEVDPERQLGQLHKC